MLDFPASPTNGQKFPQPAVPGVPVYTWDGEKWTTAGGEIVTATPATALPLINATPAVVGVTLKYAREDHVHPTDTTRASVGITESALAYSGMQINGGMEVSQEFGDTGTSTSDAHICDGWRFTKAGTWAATATRTPGLTGFGFYNWLNTQITTAQASLGATDFAMTRTYIEGFRVNRLQWGSANAQPITVSFWSGHFRPGLYTVVARNKLGNRAYAVSYTHAASNVWQYNSVTILGDTTGTWEYTNLLGIEIDFSFGCGSTYTTPALNAWQAGAYLAGFGQINGVAATSDVFRITGVTVLSGTQAPTAAQSPNIMRPYDQELVTCQRYWESDTGLIVQCPVVGTMAWPVAFNTTKRAVPTCVATVVVNAGISSLSVVGASLTTFTPQIVTTAVAGSASIKYTADARL